MRDKNTKMIKGIIGVFVLFAFVMVMNMLPVKAAQSYYVKDIQVGSIYTFENGDLILASYGNYNVKVNGSYTDGVGYYCNSFTVSTYNGNGYLSAGKYKVIGNSAAQGASGTLDLSTDISQPGSISYTETSVNKTYGDTGFTNPLTHTGNGTVSYSSGNTAVATVDTTGLVTIKGAGSATITATVEDTSEYKYENKSVSYTLTVNKAANPIDYANQSWSTDFSTAAQTKTLSQATNNQGTVTYSLQSQKSGSNAVNYFSFNASTRVLTASANTPVGTYTVVVRASAAGNGNYNSGYKDSTVTVTINKDTNPLTYTSTQSVTKTFSTSSQTGQLATASNGQGTVSYAINSQKQGSTNVFYFTLSGTTLTIAANTPVGTYTVVVRATAAGNSNYNSGTKDSTVTVIINKADINPSVTMNGWTYGSTATIPSVTGNSGNGSVTYKYKVSSADDSTYTETKPSNAGIYTVQATIAATNNYNGKTVTNNFTISKKSITVSGITASNKTYNGNTTATFVTNNATFNGKLSDDILTVSVTGTFDNKNVGTGKTVTISGLTLGGASVGNYQLATSGQQTSTTADITAKTLTITATAKSKTYGSADPALTYTSNGLIGSDNITGALSRDSGENVGSYAIKQGTLSAGNNYSISYTGANLTINKKTLSIMAEPKSKTYGEVDPTLTYTASGFERDDTESVITGNLSRVQGENAGTYTINKNTLAAGNNYDINYTSAALNIFKKEVSLEWTDTSFTYDGTAHKPIAIAKGLISNDSCEVEVSGEQTNCRKEAYTATAASLTNSNYSLPDANTTTFTIAKRPVTITAKNQSVVLNTDITKSTDQVTVSETGTGTGLVTGQSLTSIKLTASSTGNTTTEGTITPSEAVIKNGETDVTANYNIAYVNGTLTVTKGTPVVTAPTAKNLTYNKQDQVLITAGSSTGGTIQYSLDKEGWTDENADWTYDISDIKAEHAGTYKIHYRVVGNEDYFDMESAVMTAEIKKKDITISDIKVCDKTYDKTTDATLNYDDVVYSGIENGDVLSVTATGTFENENAGTAKKVSIIDITLGGVSINDYKLAAAGQQSQATATINKKVVGLTWNTDTFTFNGRNQKPAAIATGLEDGDICTITVTGENTPAGSYTATASALDNDNYKLPENPTQAFTIQPKEIKAEDITMGHSEGLEEGHYAYNGESITPNVVASSVLVQGEEATVLIKDTDYNMSREKSALVTGSHIIKFDFKGNYKGTVYKQWIIEAQTITVTAVDAEKTYGEDDPELKFTVSDDKVSPDDLLVNVERAEGQNVGTYDINVTGEETQGDFKIIYKKGTFTINKAVAVVKAVNKSKTYGDENPTLTAKVTGLKSGDEESVLTYTLSRAEGEDAGSYTITPAGEAVQGNYTVTYQTGTLKITKRKMDASFVSLDRVSFADDGTNHSPVPVFKNYTLTEGTDYEVSGETTANDKGEHTITVTGKGTNFTGSIVLKWYITSIADDTVTYDGQLHTITYDEADGVTFKQADGTYLPIPPSYKNAGSHDIEYKTTVDNPMYGYIQDVPEKLSIDGKATLTINPAELTVTAENKTKIYGEDDPEYTFTVEGLIDGETVDDVFTNKTLGRVKDDNDNVGEHDIVKGSLAVNGNYVIKTFNKGTLTITKKPLVVSAFDIKLKPVSGTDAVELNGNEVPYGSNEFEVEVTPATNIEGLGTVTVKYYSVNDKGVETELTPSGTKPKNAGKYKIKLEVTEGDNYSGTGDTLFTDEKWYFVIAKAPFPQDVPDSSWPTGCTGLSYTGSEQVLMTAATSTTGITEVYTVKYSTDGTTWSDYIPKGTAAGAYKVYVKYAADSNHSDSQVKEYMVTIEKKDNPETALVEGDFTVTKASGENTADGVISGFNAGKSYEYSTDSGKTWTSVSEGVASVSGIEPGDVQIRYSGDTNTKPGAAITIAVGYKASQDAPAAGTFTVIKTSGTDKRDGVISGVNNTMEYSTDNGVHWTSVPDGNTKIEGLGAGQVKIRKKGDVDHNPSEAITVTIGVKENQAAPVAGIFTVTKTSGADKTDGVINGVDDSIEYSIDNGQTWKNVPSNNTKIEGLGVGTVKIRYKETNDKKAGAETEVMVGAKSNQNAPDEDAIKATKASGADKNDGVINGVNDTMEYSTDGGKTWNSVDADKMTIEGLGAGEVKLRKKGDENNNPSEPITVTIRIKETQSAPEEAKITVTKTSGADKNDGVINGVDDIMEYSTNGGKDWTPVEEGKERIDYLPAGEVLIRNKGDENTNPSDVIKVTIGTKEDQGDPDTEKIELINASGEDNTDGVIAGVDDTMEYSTDGGKTWTPVDKGKTSIEGLGVGEVLIRHQGDSNTNPSKTVTITIGVTSRTQGVVNLNKADESEGEVVAMTVVESAQSSNIEEFAETQVEEGKDVKVELEITPKKEEEVDIVSVNETKNVVGEVFSGIEKEKVVTEYLEIDLTKYVNNVKENEKISDTKTPLEIELTYDKSKTSNPMIVRTHNNKACVFRKLSDRPAGNFMDATYYVANGIIYIYSQFFSDFAIIYATETTYTVSIDTGVGDPIIQVVGEESKIDLPTDLKKDGFSFGGWYKDIQYSSPWDNDNDKVNEDTKIYGKWDKSVTGVDLTSDATLELKKAGDISQIKVSVVPSDAANTKVTYSSSDTKVATVDDNGKITAVANGTATITVTTEDGNKTAIVKVTVAIPEVKPQGTTDNSKTKQPATTEKSAATEQPVVEQNAKEKAEIAMNSVFKISQTGSKISLSWGKVEDADGYEIYAQYCGKKFKKKPNQTLKRDKTKATITKINGKKLKLKKNYKLYVVAYISQDI